MRIGTSGYQYDHWKGVFYPGGLPKPKWFEYYASNFSTVEINYTFYRLPEIKVFDVYAYFNNDACAYAVKNARELLEITVGTLNGAHDDIRSSPPFTFQGA